MKVHPPRRALWIVITRPDNLPNALAVAEALQNLCPGGAHLILEQSRWWARAGDWADLRARFAGGVHEFPRIASCRGLRDLPRLVRATCARQRALTDLPAGAGDLAVILAGMTKLGNAVVSACAAAGRPRAILCVPVRKYEELCAPVHRRNLRWTVPGWLQNRVVEPLAGLHRTLHLKARRQQGGDGVRTVRFAQAPETVFGPIVLLSQTGHELPAGVGPTVRAAPPPNLARLAASVRLASSSSSSAPDIGAGGAPAAARRPWVLFFGTPFLLVQNLPPDVYAACLNGCLERLRQHYGERCELIYHPHPAETGEPGRLRLEGFRIERGGEVAELVLFKHAPRIAAVFSVSSTVSRVALNSGLNAYALWRCFPFAPTSAAYFEALFGVVPPEFDVRSLDVAPVPYADRERLTGDGETTFGEVLRGVVRGGLLPAAPGPARTPLL